MNYEKYYARVNPRDDASKQRTRAHYRRYAGLVPASLKRLPVLDVGCAWGDLLHALAEEGCPLVTGIDRSSGQIKRAHDLGATNAIHTLDTLGYLQARPSTFGAIFLLDVLEHVPVTDQESLLVALRNALVPGGRLIIKVPNASSSVGLIMRHIDPEHTTCFTTQALKALGYMLDFSSVTVTNEIPYDNKPVSWLRDRRGTRFYFYYKLLQWFFRHWRRLEIASECGHEMADATPLAPNLVATFVR